MPCCSLLATDLPILNFSFSKMGYIMTKVPLRNLKMHKKNLNFLNNALLFMLGLHGKVLVTKELQGWFLREAARSFPHV